MKSADCQVWNAIDTAGPAVRVSVVSILVNLVLTLVKLAAGFLFRSEAMVSDAVHSASDVFSTLIVIAGVLFSEKNADDEHQYGHERLECVASMILAVLLGLTGIGIGLKGLEKIAAGNYGALPVPGTPALAAAVLSIIVKEWMFRYTKAAAGRLHSGALMADAWHHRSDALSSVGSFAGILGARLGWPVLDPAAGVVICLFIVKAALDVFRDSVNRMVDKSCSAETERAMRRLISEQEGVQRVDLLRTRLFGSRIYVDVEFSTDGDRTLTQAHGIAESVREQVETRFPDVKHCMVHVNPMDQADQAEQEKKQGCGERMD